MNQNRRPACLTLLLLGTLGMAEASGDPEVSRAQFVSSSPAFPEGRAWTSHTYQIQGVGRWRELMLKDVDDTRVISVVNPDEEGFGSVSDKLRQVGLEEGVVPEGTEVTERAENGGKVITISNSFARVATWFSPDSWNKPPVLPGGPRPLIHDGKSQLIWRETTQVMGITMEVERFREHDAYVVTDDWGGWRLERYGESGLNSVEDRNGRILWITRDLQGRLCEVIVGDSVMLRYRYESPGPSWSVKELVDLQNGRVLHRWNRGALPTIARARMEAVLPWHGMVAEWDPVVAPDGVAVAGLGGLPYALIPFDGSAEPVRSRTLGDRSADYSWDRIDYTDTTITLHVILDGPKRKAVVADIPRRFPSTVPLDHVEGFPGTNCCLDCCGSGGGGGGGEPSGLPLTPTQNQQVSQAKQRGIRVLNDIPACAALFTGLNETQGVSVLGETSYRAAESDDPRCSGNDAYTMVNSFTVFICPGFSGLSQSDRAARLIHEALHSAGLTEKPQYPNAERTSAEINAWVKSTCNL